MPGEPLLRIRHLADPVGLLLSGEADMGNQHSVRTALDSLRTVTDCCVTLDVTQLSFADICTARMLHEAADGFDSGLRLIGCSPMLAMLLATVQTGPSGHLRVEVSS